MINGFRCIRANIMPICFAGISIIVICPLVNNPIIRITYISISSSPRKSARTAEQFT